MQLVSWRVTFVLWHEIVRLKGLEVDKNVDQAVVPEFQG